MAARFLRSFSQRGAVFCLLLMQSVADSPEFISRERNGFAYTFSDSEDTKTWAEANSACPHGLIWLENLAELNWAKAVFSELDEFWVAAKGDVSHWPNGRSFPPDIVESNRNPHNCVAMDVSNDKLTWIDCTSDKMVICKSQCAHASSTTFSRALAASRSQTAAEQQAMTEPSLIACSARCLGDRACCAFEFEVESGRCRFLAETRHDLRAMEEGHEVFVAEP